MISTVKIGQIPVTITEVETLHSTHKDGSYRKMDGRLMLVYGTIELDKDLIDEAKPGVLLHEILHGILELAGQYEQPEGLIDAIAFGLVPLIRDNPELIKMIQAGA